MVLVPHDADAEGTSLHLGRIFIPIADQIPYNHSAQLKLVDLLEHIKENDDLSNPGGPDLSLL